MPIEFKISVIKNRSGTQAVKMAMSGGIDGATIGEFKQVMEKLLEKGAQRMVLDLALLTFINSTGLGALLSYVDRLESKGGGLILTAVPPKVKTVFDMMGFTPVLKFAPGSGEALMQFQQNARGVAPPASTAVQQPSPSKPSPPEPQKTERIEQNPVFGKPLTGAEVHQFLRRQGIMESPVIHEVRRDTFLQERGIQRLGAGSEGSVHFVRGHVVKVVGPNGVPAALREMAHMLYLNPRRGSESIVGDRIREDWPSLVWIYVFSAGGLSVGMRAFDPEATQERGADLRVRLTQGPPMGRAQVLFVLRALGRTLAYAHNQGIVHHDLKPENIWVPADPARAPILFDLGQALWQQGTFGRDWLEHEYNQPYLYNGTYRYMHRLRRYAHLGARDLSAATPTSQQRREALEKYKPSYFDDIFAFGRIVRDFVRSRQAELTERDRKALSAFAQRLMARDPTQSKARAGPGQSSISGRLSSIFKSPFAQPQSGVLAVEGRRGSMAQWVIPELERVLEFLEATQASGANASSARLKGPALR